MCRTGLADRTGLGEHVFLIGLFLFNNCCVALIVFGFLPEVFFKDCATASMVGSHVTLSQNMSCDSLPFPSSSLIKGENQRCKVNGFRQSACGAVPGY